MAKKGKRQDAQHGITGAQRRKRVPLVAEGLSPRNRARALIRLRELERHYREISERVAASEASAVVQWSGDKGTLDASQLSEELQVDLLDLKVTKAAVKDLAAQLHVSPQEQTEDTLKLIGQALDGSHRRGKRREQKPTEMR